MQVFSPNLFPNYKEYYKYINIEIKYYLSRKCINTDSFDSACSKKSYFITKNISLKVLQNCPCKFDFIILAYVLESWELGQKIPWRKTVTSTLPKSRMTSI